MECKKSKKMDEQNRNRLADAENKQVVSREVGGREMSEVGEED